MLNISSGITRRAQKVLIYGAEGIGKTTLAACFPEPLFIDTEGGSTHLDVRRIDRPTTFDALINILLEVANTPGLCKTLVIDTVDWMEQIATDQLLAVNKKTSIESFGYGKGYTYLAEMFTGKFFPALNLLIDSGIHVVLTAHAKMRKFEQPDEIGAYDRWELKLSKQVAPLVKEWCDMILFCNYQTNVVTLENGARKAQGGKRVMYTSHHPCWDAKNRHNLPEVLDMDYANIAHCFELETPLQSVRKLMERDGVTDEQLIEVMHKRGQAADINIVDSLPDKLLSDWVLKYWNNIMEVIKNG